MKRVFGILILGILAGLACSKTAVREQLPPYDEYRQAMNYYEKGDYLKAQAEFQRVIYSFPGLTFIDTAQYHLAMSYYNDKSYPRPPANSNACSRLTPVRLSPMMPSIPWRYRIMNGRLLTKKIRQKPMLPSMSSASSSTAFLIAPLRPRLTRS